MSVNKATGSVHDLSEVGNGDRFPFLQSETAASDGGVEAFQGSHTLPRKKSKGGGAGASQPPDHVIITSRPADGGNSVRIQIGGAQQDSLGSMNRKSKAAPSLNDPSPKRKYSLKEVEVEGLLSSSEEGEDVVTVPRGGHRGRENDHDEDMFDLNSLIEGAVDDDEDEEDVGPAGPKGPALDSSQMYFRPVRDAASSAGSLTPKSKATSGRLQRVEDDQVWVRH